MPSPQDALALPSLADFRATLDALLHAPYPPRSLFIQASSNVSLLADLIHAALPTTTSTSLIGHAGPTPLSDGETREPDVQDLLPQAVIVDCAEIASTKALFGRILNGLSGWGKGEWNDALGGVLNWDGRQEGYHVEKDARTGTYSLTWDYKNAVETVPSSASIKGGIVDRKDESLSAFLEGLKMIFTLGGESGSSAQERGKQKPRFVILLNAERLPELESLPVGQTEGTLLASFMRLGELTGKPIVPILTSQSEWLLLRPARGATEPGATLQLPALRRQDVTHYLRTVCAHDLQASSTLTAEQHLTLLASLADVIHQTFEPYIGDELVDYLWLTEKLWPDWRRPVESGTAEAGDVNRLLAMSKPALSREIEALGELRPLVLDEEELEPTSGAALNEPEGQSSGSKDAVNGVDGTPKRPSSLAAFYTNPTNNTASLPGFSPHAVTPSKRSRPDALASASSANLAGSLSVLSRYILIAAFLASSNPSKKDMQMLATQEDELALSKRRKKGGAMRKTPNRKGATACGAENEGSFAPIRKKDTQVPQRMLGPKPFPIERLIAITETILPVELRSLANGPDMLQEISSLTSLRLLLKTSASASLSTYPTFATASSISPFDRLDGIKLKCSTGLELEYVEQIGKSVGFKVAERLWETFG